ncbi:class I SAM-dependent methyltransferase [Hymenobacter lucidus]|uniref:Methyltransferase domain-containing protein n=1 Tax=Hymenobacter lucidus TaxID=2880930 RepID=A0ABS8APE5_9BACT|nr:methyltransferase domain-containing protein [Hymenobacter lucidus]MCB2407893.1 methyltransferase domain-containing protein [Hymenobacter lucidus]
MRKPLEGVWNVVRFNWHFYGLAAGALLVLAAVAAGRPAWRPYCLLLMLLAGGPLLVSLLVSYYVYDRSALYKLSWLPAQLPAGAQLVNIHAGFDETSSLLQQRFAPVPLRVFDFYDPALHTEVSIRRARAAYPAFPGTQPATPAALPLPAASISYVFVLLAAHEIRSEEQRVVFFRELRRVLAPGGRVVVVEHLRDAANFWAYTIGFLHFYSRSTWLRAFGAAGLTLVQEKKITPFVSAFILAHDGAAT